MFPPAARPRHNINDAGMAEAGGWQARPPGPMYPMLLLRRTARENRRGCGGGQQGDLTWPWGAARQHACARQPTTTCFTGQRDSVRSKPISSVRLHEASLLDQSDDPAINLPQHSPKPIWANSRVGGVCARRISSSPSSKKERCSPDSRINGSCPPRVVSIKLPKPVASGAEMVPDPKRSPDRRLQPFEVW